MAKGWEEMSWSERREARYSWWIKPDGVSFKDTEAEKRYQAKVQRIIKAYKVEEPDRVPVSLPVEGTPAYLAGTNVYSVMYDYEELVAAWKQFNLDFLDADTLTSPSVILPGKVYDLLDYKLYSYPGRGLPKEAEGVQFVEGEYMKAEEYDALIRNPSDFWMRVYMPRVFGFLESWKMLQPFTNIIELPATHFIPYANPKVRDSALKLIEIGKELAVWSEYMAGFSRWATEWGFPTTIDAMAKAPFDTLGDTLRGTKGIITDLYRRPEKLLEAIEVITDVTIDQIISSANASKAVSVIFPLHKGADGFMSQRQFDRFYWPSLKKVLQALINEGILPVLFAEGSYNSRLESVNEFPKGAVAWLFDRSNMRKAKQILGTKCCISGNVPSSLLIKGTPEEVKAYCRELIDACAAGGGYILAGGADVNNAGRENLRAMLDAAVEYGTYELR